MTKRRQVNLRLSEAQYRVLEALAFLQRSPKAEVLVPLVSSFLEQQAEDPHVRNVLERLERSWDELGDVDAP